MPARGGIYTENLREFMDDLNLHFEPVRQFGLPPFGDYLVNFLRNSNLGKEGEEPESEFTPLYM